jgi:catechol 2,3-dioxygenase-like lactoylglutathione lyase family enzyme
MQGRIELIVVPVEDVDRAKEFYVEQCGFHLLVDHRPNEHFRVVQCLPEGSECAIAFGTSFENTNPPGSVQGLHVMVTDIVAARDELIAGGVDVEPIFNFTREGVRSEGAHAERADYSSFAQFRDPDGNGWLLQERGFAG